MYLVKDLAEELGVTKQTIFEIIKCNDIQVAKVGKVYQLDEAQADQVRQIYKNRPKNKKQFDKVEEVEILQQRIADLEKQLAVSRARVELLESENSFHRSQLMINASNMQKLIEQRQEATAPEPPEREQTPPPRRSLKSWLFGEKKQ